VLNSYDADFGEWGTPDQTLVPGEGAFILNPSDAAFTVTFVGEVPQGDVSVNIPAGYSIVSSKVPQSGTLGSLGYVPAANDTIYRFNNTTGYQPASYDPDFQAWDPSEPSVNVGESFFVFKKAAGTWTRTFSVN
jgi:hypothetical protein